jgi:hypothetical protein
MVSLLWDAGLIDAAVELEVLWNELGVQYPVLVAMRLPRIASGSCPPA